MLFFLFGNLKVGKYFAISIKSFIFSGQQYNIWNGCSVNVIIFFNTVESVRKCSFLIFDTKYVELIIHFSIDH